MTTLKPKPPYPYRGLIPVNSSMRPSIGVVLMAGTKSSTYQHQYNEFRDDTANEIFGNVFRSWSCPGSRSYRTVVVVAVGVDVGIAAIIFVRAVSSSSRTVVLSRVVAVLAKARRPQHGGDDSTRGNHRGGDGTRSTSRRHISMRRLVCSPFREVANRNIGTIDPETVFGIPSSRGVHCSCLRLPPSSSFFGSPAKSQSRTLDLSLFVCLL